MNEEALRMKIARNSELPDPTMAFLMDYRDLVISIADGQIEGDPRRLCQILGHAEIDQAIERARKATNRGK